SSGMPPQRRLEFGPRYSPLKSAVLHFPPSLRLGAQKIGGLVSMGRIFRILAFIFAGLLAVLTVAITFTIGWRPFIGPKARPLAEGKFASTPERLARGEMIFNGRMGCHSPHDWKPHEPTVLPGMKGAGMVMPIEELPGRIVAPNLTPDPETGSGTW